ncbi:hypothetical protein QQG55_39720 [Brugia pahangi]
MNTGNIAGSVHCLQVKRSLPTETQRVLSDSHMHLRNTRILNLWWYLSTSDHHVNIGAQSTTARCKTNTQIYYSRVVTSTLQTSSMKYLA